MRALSIVVLPLVVVCATLVLFLRRDAAPPPTPSVAAPTAAPATPAAAAANAAPTAMPPTGERSAIGTLRRVRGRLVRAGAPLAGASLRVFEPAERTTTEIGAVTTAADGTFAFAMPARRFFLQSDSAAVPRDWWSGWRLPQASDWDLGDLQVPHGAAVTGTVLDATGSLLAGAKVTATRGGHDHAPCTDPRGPNEQTTGADGRFAFADAHPGGCRLRAQPPGFLEAVADVTLTPGETAAVELRLRRGEPRRGFVFDWRGRPLAGATVTSSATGAVAVTDGRGWFVLAVHGIGAGVRVEAPGHLSDWFQEGYLDRGDLELRLERAVTLRGRVLGADRPAVTVHLAEAPDRAADVPYAKPYDLVGKPLPVAADGTFTIEGLALSDFLVHAEVAGGGASAPVRVALRDDAMIELEISAANVLRLVVQDGDGAPIDGAEVVVDPRVGEYWSLYQPGAAGVQARILGSYKKQVTAAAAGRAVLPRQPAAPLAFAVQAPGFLPEHRVFAAGEVPTELVLQLARAGRVLGVVHGGSATEYTRLVALWHADDAERMAARDANGERREWQPVTATVDAEGRFVAEGLRAGTWRAAVTRRSRATTKLRVDERAGALPLVDDGEDLRAVVEFTIAGGRETKIDLTEPALGTLRGRVLRRGLPCAEALVYTTRPAWRFGRAWRGDGPVDWDDDLVRNWAPGQPVGADGSFAVRYREAGAIELRVRHADGHATQPPVTVDVPPPGDDVHCTLDLEAGAIRGRFPIEQLPERERSFVKAVLYPRHKAGDDPSYSTDWVPQIAWDCAKVELPVDGRFGFDFLPAGDWIVRVQTHAFGTDPGPLWQRVVRVQGDVTDLGELAPPAKVSAALRWHWPAGDATPRSVYGVWLRQPHGDDPAAIWAGTFATQADQVVVAAPPGRYAVVPFGWWAARDALDTAGWGHGMGGITGAPLAEPCAIELHADGTVTPAELQLRPLPPPSVRAR